MQDRAIRTLDDAERRRMSVKMLEASRNVQADAQAERRALSHPLRRRTNRRPLAANRSPRPNVARLLVPLLLDLPGRVGFRAAFCAAAAAWGVALILSLDRFEVVRW